MSTPSVCPNCGNEKLPAQAWCTDCTNAPREMPRREPTERERGEDEDDGIGEVSWDENGGSD